MMSYNNMQAGIVINAVDTERTGQVSHNVLCSTMAYFNMSAGLLFPSAGALD
jgi:hypothetical protein